jgi:phosphoenolpyruvate synthase/pyruvate phosphate dikinase
MESPEHVYPAVLLLKSVNADKSGVMVTRNIDSGARDWLSVAVNEGVGGAVDGQAAESLRINTASGEVRLMAQATASVRRQINPRGGVDELPTSGRDRVLMPGEITKLVELYEMLPRRFPAIVDAGGTTAPADIEFGFVDGELKLFQIRPFLESRRARSNAYLSGLDAALKDLHAVTVNLSEVPP